MLYNQLRDYISSIIRLFQFKLIYQNPIPYVGLGKKTNNIELFLILYVYVT